MKCPARFSIAVEDPELPNLASNWELDFIMNLSFNVGN